MSVGKGIVTAVSTAADEVLLISALAGFVTLHACPRAPGRCSATGEAGHGVRVGEHGLSQVHQLAVVVARVPAQQIEGAVDVDAVDPGQGPWPAR